MAPPASSEAGNPSPSRTTPVATPMAGISRVKGSNWSMRLRTSRRYQSMSQATESTTAKIEDVRQAAGQTGASAELLSDAARMLQSQSDRLRSEVQSFLKGVLRS